MNRDENPKKNCAENLVISAPTDIFERNVIRDSHGNRYVVKEIASTDFPSKHFTKYTLHSTIFDVKCFYEILKAFETDRIHVVCCWLSGFDEDGCCVNCRVNSLDKLLQVGGRIHQYTAVFCDRETRHYCFAVSSHINATTVTYEVDYDKLYKG